MVASQNGISAVGASTHLGTDSWRWPCGLGLARERDRRFGCDLLKSTADGGARGALRAEALRAEAVTSMMNAGMSTAAPLTGTLRRAYDIDGSTGAACVLVTEEGEAFQLNTFEGSESDWTELTERCLRELAQFEARLVRVFYARKEESVFGPSLWGVRVEAV